MPELPEVENFRRLFEQTALHRTLAHIAVKEEKILHGISPATLRAALKGHQFEAARRHGKHLLARLDTGQWLTLHFGMTGGFGTFEQMEDDPRFDRVRFDFSDGSHLAYVDQRLLGEIGMTGDADGFVRERPLGTDALDPALDEAAFRKLIDSHKGSLKSLLMNQKVIAGIGNEYSDEILFQSGIHPKTRTGDMNPKQTSALYRTMRKVLRTAIDRGAGSEEYHERLPSTFLLPHRGKKAKCPVCGTRIETAKVSGRTTYFCPNCQPATTA